MIIRHIFAALYSRVFSWTTCRYCHLLHSAFCFDDAFGGTTLVSGVARLGVFLLHIKAYLRCVLVMSLPKICHRIELRERIIYRNQNEQIHNNVHQAFIQYVQFTFAQNMNMFRHNFIHWNSLLGKTVVGEYPDLCEAVPEPTLCIWWEQCWVSPPIAVKETLAAGGSALKPWVQSGQRGRQTLTTRQPTPQQVPGWHQWPFLLKLVKGLFKTRTRKAEPIKKTMYSSDWSAVGKTLNRNTDCCSSLGCQTNRGIWLKGSKKT